MGKKDETREEFYKRIKEYPDTQDITFVSKKHEGADVYSFFFSPTKKVTFKPGMYAHVVIPTVPEEEGKPVRYFSIASAPTEDYLRFTTRVRDGSVHKQKLAELKPDDKCAIYKVKGEFLLPSNKERPVVLIAGGIGITPFRSMLINMDAKEETRNITLVHVSDKDYVFQRDLSEIPVPQHRITRDGVESIIEELVEEAEDRGEENVMWYISGPPAFVDFVKEVLLEHDIEEKNIKQDEFDGYDDI